jgi:hypothetical protein
MTQARPLRKHFRFYLTARQNGEYFNSLLGQTRETATSLFENIETGHINFQEFFKNNGVACVKKLRFPGPLGHDPRRGLGVFDS